MLYDGKEYDVKLGGPSSKVVRLIRQAGAQEENGATHDDDAEDVYAELLPLLVISIDGEPPEEADGDVQWAALFAGMQTFGKLSEKKSGRKRAGKR